MVNFEIFALYDNGFSHFIGQMSRILPWKQSIFQQQCYTWDSKSDNDTSRNHNVIERRRKKINRLCILLKTSVFLATLCLNGLGIFAFTVLIICQFDNKQRECSDSISVAFNASSDDIISFQTHFECVNRFQCKYFDVNASIALDYLSFCVNDFATTLSKWIEPDGIGDQRKRIWCLWNPNGKRNKIGNQNSVNSSI